MNMIFKFRDIEFHLEIRGKFNVIIGNSGTGKSYLAKVAEIIRQDRILSKQQPAEILGDSRLLESWAKTKKGAVIVVDEGIDLEIWRKLIPIMENSSNYYIICTREGDASIPYGVDNTFIMERTGKRYRMLPAFSMKLFSSNPKNFKGIVTEDSTVGFNVVEKLSNGRYPVVTSSGKSTISTILYSLPERQVVLFDSCGIGIDFNNLLISCKANKAIMYNSKSFEYEVLVNIFTKYFIAYSEQVYDKVSNEETYYTLQLNILFNKLFSLSYNKSNKVFVDLITGEKCRINKNLYSLKDVGLNCSRLYEFLQTDTNVRLNQMNLA